MKEKWYEEIINLILETKTDIILIIVPVKLIQFPKIRQFLGEKFNEIVEFKSEIQLRKQIRKKEKMIVIFTNKESVPFDYLSKYATVEIDLDDIFPLLNKKILLQYPVDSFQEIYEAYDDFKKEKYERSSEEESKKFIENILSKKFLKEKETSLRSINQIEDYLRNESLDAEGWGRISQIYGELNYLIDDNELNLDIENLKSNLKNEFRKYILNNYENLIYSTNSLIHSNLLEIIFNDSYEKIALICYDCMGFEEWNTIREYLNNNFEFEYNEKYSFSMLPSETSYSGNALFGGLPPKRIKELHFIKNIHWRNEEQLFKHFLSDRKNIEENNVFFKRCVEPNDVPLNENHLKDYKAIGIVFSFIDRYTHFDLMNKTKLIKNIKIHLKNSRLDVFIHQLLKNGFRLFFTSDHGSIFCQGNGVNVKKDLVNSKAKRYLISNKKELLEEYRTNDSELIQFRNIIGDNYLLLLNGDSMFASKNEEGLTHGGISIEEMIVPFIEVKNIDGI